MNIETFLSNPELAKNVRFEITGENLLELASMLAKSVQVPKEKEDGFVSNEYVLAATKVKSKSTLWRWHKKGILKHNQIGLYKKSDVIRFLNKQ